MKIQEKQNNEYFLVNGYKPKMFMLDNVKYLTC